MGVVTSDLLAGTLTSFRALFQRDFQAAADNQFWTPLASPMDSNGEINSYNWFGTVPKMEDVTHGTASINGLPKYDFSIYNKEFQAVIEVERAVLERDQLNLIAPRISQLALEAARHPGELILNLFESNPTTFDGTAMFADSHNVSTFDNLLAGTGLDTVAHFQADLSAARAVLRTVPDDRGRPMNLIGNIIVVPPAGEQLVWQALNTSALGSVQTTVPPATNNKSWSAAGYTVIVNPYLTDDSDWYLLHDGGPTERPFIMQTEKSPVVESDTNPNTREAIIQRNYLYSVYGRYNVGVTDPRFAVKTANS